MPWFYVDDGFSDSKPVMNIEDRYRLAACGIWVLAGSWSAKEELDGFVPESKLRQLGSRPPIIAALTATGPMSAPLCSQVSGGIQFNSWDKWQPTKAELAAERAENERKREAEAERKRRERAEKNEHNPPPSRRRRKGRGTVASGNTDGSRVVSESCPAGQTTDVRCDSRAGAGARLDPTRPDPTRPVFPLVNSGGEVTSVTASEAPPRPECPDHEENYDGPCRRCKQRREWDEHHAAQAEADELDTKRQERIARAHAIAACPRCDEVGWVLGSEPVVKCNHPEARHA